MNAPTCPSYVVMVACPRCEAVAVKAQVFPSGSACDVVAEYGCAACGAVDFPESAYREIQEAAWDMEPPRRLESIDAVLARVEQRERAYAAAHPRTVPSETAPDRYGNPHFSDREQIAFFEYFLREIEKITGTDRQIATLAEAWWMGDWEGNRCPALEQAERFLASRR